MGIIVRQQGCEYVIASDRLTGEARTKKAPKGRPSESYEVWTGDIWSSEMIAAKKFGSPDDADEYVRANFAQVTAQR